MPESRVVKVTARSLKNAEATFISMVDRGANRLPIRMLKNEGKNMLNLERLFLRKSEDKTPQEPSVLGVLVPEASAEGYAQALKSEDNEIFVLDTDTEGVKFVSYKEEASLEGAMILKGSTDESPAVVVDTAQKQLSDFGFDPEQGFAGSVVSYGFYSNIRAAMNVLFDAMFDILETAEPGTPPLERAQTLLDEFNTYMVSLLQTVPTEAFKMEKLQPVVNQDDAETTQAEASKGEGDGEAVEGELVTEGEGQGEAAKGESEGEDEAQKQGAVCDPDSPEYDPEACDRMKAEEAAAEGEGEAVAEGTEQKNEGNEQLQQILDQMSSFGSTMQTLNESVNGLKEEIGTVKNTVTEQGEQIAQVSENAQKAEEKAQAAKESASSVVIDTDNGRTDAQKQDDNYDPEHVDRRNRNIEYV